MSDIGESLLSAFDFVWGRLRGRLAGLTDAEYFWQPADDCWTLRRDDDGTWRLDGDGGGGPAPDPAPVTTIAWRLCHLAGLALGGFTDRRFPGLSLTEESLPTTAEEALAFADRSYDRWRQGMESLSPEDWWAPLGEDWGPYAEDSSVDLALHVLDELVHHGAEVSLLRDLYPHRAEAPAPAKA